MTQSGPVSELVPAGLSRVAATDYPRESCIHELLEQQALRSPDAVAVEFEGKSTTYKELHFRANQLARLLTQRGVGPDVLVGICLERSLEMVVAVLGVIKAGGAYVPLDPAHGKGRIQYILDEAQVKVLLTQEAVLPSLLPLNGEVVCLDPAWSTIAREDGAPVSSAANAANLAYVIYTSGSTGKPKGVQVEHRSVVNFLCSMRREPGLNSTDVLLAVTTLSFDIAGLEIFLPLLVGARVVVANRETTYDGALLSQLMDRSGVTVMQATPATWRLLFESEWTGNRKLKVLVGGEAVPSQLARTLAARCGEVWNMYGPTETTIWSSLYRIRGDESQTVPIGKPIANTALYILDGVQPVPEGSEGELCIGGEGLARGYFQKPELTREKFVPDPFSMASGARMYRTGDLVRLLPEGDVAFLGRLDHQVKIRGFRVELGEIESVLEQHPLVRHAVAMAREDASGDSYLAAWFVPAHGEKPTAASLRQHLRGQLPEYMVPSAFVDMDELPLTHNGKVDRKALPEPSVLAAQSEEEYVAPRDEVERKLATLWQEALRRDRVGVRDNFFDLGGRSLLAARLFVKISREFGKELPISVLVHAPTIELLAGELRSGSQNAGYRTLVPIRPGGSRPPFFCVHGGGGSTLFLQHLADRLSKAGWPFYGIEPDCLDGSPTNHETVEEMASFYLTEIRKVQPSGPYYLGGYCFGALVAYEMALQLSRSGETAAAVVLFTGPLRFNRPPSRVSTSAQGSRGSWRIAPPHAFLSLRWHRFSRFLRKRRTRTIRWMSWLMYKSFFAAGMKIPPKLRAEYVRRTLIRAELGYAPKPWSGNLTLIYGSNLKEFGPDLGWGGLAGGLEHHVIGTSNYQTRREQFDEPIVDLTAQTLNACLENAVLAAGRHVVAR